MSATDKLARIQQTIRDGFQPYQEDVRDLVAALNAVLVETSAALDEDRNDATAIAVNLAIEGAL